ncbi:ECF-type sigma factor [Aeoliella sp. ICT_H6.2]|uniref:ECF-type sigma factor n=1 Tax=Aeoliella straminimaris TaxID=2954799 RepID=A0A9X2FBH4_9BACT|nr:ECF-type sigma factor [Aeoliella straminimaris]MCO6045113.1 ECF-type sigma factor [Aeoliella straminimaris]
MADVTHILSQIESGDPSAAEQLLPLVYQELRELAAAKIAHEKPGHTLEATALVHEAYLRMVDSDKVRSWNGRQHFLAVAAIAMRRILIEWARKKAATKRGGDRHKVDLDDVELMSSARPDTILAIDEALEQLSARAPESARVAELRLFAGLSLQEVAEALNTSTATAHRHWVYARASLHDFLTS